MPRPGASGVWIVHRRCNGSIVRRTLDALTVEDARHAGGMSRYILPALGHLRVGSVVRADIARFFHEYGRRKPGGANRSHEILRNMFDYAIAWGHRSEAAGNPCKGIVRYRRPPRGRLLGAVLRQREDEKPVCVAAVRLLLLTGCRPGKYAACAGARSSRTA